MTLDERLLTAALAYAAHGWAVFPLAGKRPATDHGVHDATTSPAQIRTWWGRTPAANIGIACGAPSGDLLVVDLDGAAGYATWRRLCHDHAPDGYQPPTLLQATGGGGAHLLYRCPIAAARRNTAGRLGLGVDTRGDGGYIVAAPSIHPDTGARYQWGVKRPVLDAPAWLVDLLAARPDDAPPVRGEPLRLAPPPAGYGAAALDGLARSVATAAAGTRNVALNYAAWRAGRLGAIGVVDEHQARSVLGAAARASGLADREISATFRSGWMSGLADPAPLPALRLDAPRVAPTRIVPPRILLPRIAVPRLRVPRLASWWRPAA